MRKPNILIIENSIAITGALKSIVRSSHVLKAEYTFVFLLPANSSATAYVRELGFEAYELPMKEIRKNILSLIIYFPMLFYNAIKLFQITRRLNIDLIAVNDFYNLLPTVYKIAGGNVPYICYIRFLPTKFPNALVKFWCALHRRYAHVLIAVSEVVKKTMPFQSRVLVISNELPAEVIEFNSAARSTTLLYPANYIRGKGHEFALESFSRIARKHPDWKLKFFGGDMGLEKNKQFKNDLSALARSLKVEAQVEFHSFAEKISEEYLNAAIVLNFSESESFSLTCLEAMFYGRPVIATRSGGPSEIVDHNESGILVEVKDVTAMAQAIDELISNPEKRELMSRTAYERVRQKFSHENTVQKLAEVYKAAIKDY
jgi:L-malate glycosyltransferase